MSNIVRPGLEQIDGSGATIGQAPIWDGGVWKPGISGVGTIVPGANVTVDNSDPAHPVLNATSSRELLMADGVTSPPVPIETEAGDDWLYQD